MATAYADEVKRVRSLGVEAGDIAEATGAEIGTVSFLGPREEAAVS